MVHIATIIFDFIAVASIQYQSIFNNTGITHKYFQNLNP